MLHCEFENGKKASLRHAVVDVLVVQDDKLLLVKRSPHLLEGGKWALIGGFVERDETLVEAAVREVQEETGWKVTNLQLLRIIDSPQRRNEDRQNIAFIYASDAVEKIGQPDDESTEQRWFAFDALPSAEIVAFDHFDTISHYLQTRQ